MKKTFFIAIAVCLVTYAVAFFFSRVEEKGISTVRYNTVAKCMVFTIGNREIAAETFIFDRISDDCETKVTYAKIYNSIFAVNEGGYTVVEGNVTTKQLRLMYSADITLKVSLVIMAWFILNCITLFRFRRVH